MLKDISNGGLAFQYIAEAGTVAVLTEVILYKDEGFLFGLEALPCRIVYDWEVIPLVNDLCVRRCGVRFGELSRYQQIRLDSLMYEHAAHSRAMSTFPHKRVNKTAPVAPAKAGSRKVLK
jgi:hypothetical protein